ncbi:hypothetical protein [Mycobacteroides sp. LB1]|uniref:hypothetical protein n=1 Tax=Mycobacteroides sp. LB1 TaxID=2750814 RepID=UPI0015DDEED7|nr:hypothetical protein [Mycobacteroides sp. LB1]
MQRRAVQRMRAAAERQAKHQQRRRRAIEAAEYAWLLADDHSAIVRIRRRIGALVRHAGAGALDELLWRQLLETRQLAEKHEAEIETYLQIDPR